MSADCPLARSDGLITEELDGELLVYDSDSNLAHALDAEAAALWRACDGHADTQALAAHCGSSEEDVRNTLARLGELGLLEVAQADEDGDTRRNALRKIAISGVGLAAVPMISSILVPTPAMAQSGSPLYGSVLVESGSAGEGLITDINVDAQSGRGGVSGTVSFTLNGNFAEHGTFTGTPTCLSVYGDIAASSPGCVLDVVGADMANLQSATIVVGPGHALACYIGQLGCAFPVNPPSPGDGPFSGSATVVQVTPAPV